MDGVASVLPLSVIAVTVTFRAAGTPLLLTGSAVRSVPSSTLAPGLHADKIAGVVAHSTSTVRKLPGLEASVIVADCCPE